MKHDKLKQECFDQDNSTILASNKTAARSRSSSITLENMITAEEFNKDRTFLSINNVNSWINKTKTGKLLICI